MGGVKLDRIEAGLFGPHGRLSEGRDDVRYVWLAHGQAGGLAILGNGGGTDWLQSGQREIRKPPAVDNLQGNFSARLMDRLNHSPQPGHETLVMNGELAGTRLSLGADERVTADDQADLAPGQLNHHFGES